MVCPFPFGFWVHLLMNPWERGSGVRSVRKKIRNVE
jgi:hypothetical protein